jgi:hypothetical protein
VGGRISAPILLERDTCPKENQQLGNKNANTSCIKAFSMTENGFEIFKYPSERRPRMEMGAIRNGGRCAKTGGFGTFEEELGRPKGKPGASEEKDLGRLKRWSRHVRRGTQGVRQSTTFHKKHAVN